MRRISPLRLLFSFSLLPVVLSACQVVAGIEERKLDPNAGSDKLCNEYCDAVLANCTEKNGHAVYGNRDQCMGVCRKLPQGDSQETPNENSVRCRLDYANSAEREPDDCLYAGPGGNDQCGSDCEAYCSVFPKACPDDFKYEDEAACIQACSGLTDQKDRFDLKLDHEGDSIECRLVHTSSSTVDPATHCAHATIIPAEPWCIGKKDVAPTCEEYCKIELAACGNGEGPLAQYEDESQCLAACEALPKGVNSDTTGNTVGCRRYHSFSSTLLPETHCFHSGPTGDGHCGAEAGNCESYCAIVSAACADDFSKTFADPADCEAKCADLPEAGRDSKFTLVSAESSKDFQCRVLHALRAFKDATQCASALGGGDCQ